MGLKDLFAALFSDGPSDVTSPVTNSQSVSVKEEIPVVPLFKTKVGTGYSNNSNTEEGVSEALGEALKKIGSESVDFILVFASTNHDFKVMLEKIKEIADTDNIAGCSTAGEFYQGNAGTGGITIMAIRSDTIKFSLTKTTNVKNRYDIIASEAFRTYQKQSEDMKKQGFENQTVLVLTDGLMSSQDELTEIIYSKTGANVQLVGGAAADEVKFEKTSVFYKTDVLSNAIVFIKLFSINKVGVGVMHGMKPDTEPMKVTKASGGKLQEINKRPAFEVYKEHAKLKGIDITPENAFGYMIHNEIGIKDLTFSKIRAPLSVNEDGSLNMAAEVPQGCMITIVSSSKDALISAAKTAATEAKNNLKGGNASAVLVFDCICRQTILAEDYIKEVQTISEVLDSAPTIGFSTYGEIAKTPAKLNGFHNSTVVVCALPE